MLDYYLHCNQSKIPKTQNRKATCNKINTKLNSEQKAH